MMESTLYNLNYGHANLNYGNQLSLDKFLSIKMIDFFFYFFILDILQLDSHTLTHTLIICFLVAELQFQNKLV